MFLNRRLCFSFYSEGSEGIWAAARQNQQTDMCAQRKLRSAWASAQSDQSLRCPHEESLGPWLPIERTAKTLIRLGGCPGWSESSLGAQAILLVLSWRGSFETIVDWECGRHNAKVDRHQGWDWLAYKWKDEQYKQMWSSYHCLYRASCSQKHGNKSKN